MTLTLHSSDFGWIANLAAAFLSLWLLIVAVHLSKRINENFHTDSISSLVVILSCYIIGFSVFIFIPLLLSTAAGYSLHWLHEMIRGPLTYGNSGYASSYEFGTQLLLLGLFECVLGTFLSCRNYLKNFHSKTTRIHITTQH